MLLKPVTLRLRPVIYMADTLKAISLLMMYTPLHSLLRAATLADIQLSWMVSLRRSWGILPAMEKCQ